MNRNLKRQVHDKVEVYYDAGIINHYRRKIVNRIRSDVDIGVIEGRPFAIVNRETPTHFFENVLIRFCDFQTFDEWYRATYQTDGYIYYGIEHMATHTPSEERN